MTDFYLGDGNNDPSIQQITLGNLDLNTNSTSGGYTGSGFSLPPTLSPVDPNMTGGVTLSNGVPDNVVNTPRSDGITVSGVLQGVTSTADSLLNVFGKAYTLYNQGQALQYSAKLADSSQQLQYAQSQAQIDLAKTKVATDAQLGQMNAQAQIANAAARLQAGAAGFIKTPTGKITTGMIVAGIAAFLLLKKAKAV